MFCDGEGGGNRWIPMGSCEFTPSIGRSGKRTLTGSSYKRHKNKEELKKEIDKVSKLSKKEKVKITDEILIQMLKELVESDKNDVTINDVLEPVKALMILKYGDDFNKRYKDRKDKIVARRVSIVYEKNLKTEQEKYPDRFKTTRDYTLIFLKLWIGFFVLAFIYVMALLIGETISTIDPHPTEQVGLQMPVPGTANTPEAEQSMILRYKQIWPSGN